MTLQCMVNNSHCVESWNGLALCLLIATHVRVYEGSDGKYVSLYEGITEDPKDSQYTLLLSYYLVIYYNILINDLTSTLISVTVTFLHPPGGHEESQPILRSVQ